MMTDVPRVSIVLPVYNAEQYLSLAVDSILAQTLDDFELIVVNDGSSDGSGDILAEYARKDPRVRVITQENQGVVAACNAGVFAAQGVLIARMDADDIADPERLSVQVTFMETHPDVVAVGAHVKLIDPKGRALKILKMPLEHAGIDAGNLMGGHGICHPAAMIRTEAIRKIDGYRPEFVTAEDIDLFLRLGEIGRLANLDQVLLDYRQHPQSIGYSKRSQQKDTAWRARSAAAERRGISLEVESEGLETPPPTLSAIFRRWGWWALAGGHVGTARHYGMRAVLAGPFDLANWKLALIAMRGY